MDDIKIYDNFLENENFYDLQEFILSDDFAWYYGTIISDKDSISNYQFVHYFYAGLIPYQGFEVLEPILKILKPKALDRVKVNCLPRSNEIIISGLHTDLDETDIPWKTALLYVNTNNGYTIFENKTKVESIENRLCIFPHQLKHSGTTCTDKNRRIVLNINYIS
tara:strand:+ start:1356 stop:1850 length:495 start_codon:yes stop_codon:yes gene_type:complete